MCTKLTSDTKVRGLYPLGTTNVCTTFHSTPFLRCLSLDQLGGLTDIPTHRAMSLKRIINMSNKTQNNKKIKIKKNLTKGQFRGSS